MQQQRKGHKNGVDILMHLPKGQTSDWNPYSQIRTQPRQSVCIALIVSKRVLFFGFPLLLKSNYSRRDFRGLFGKCEIISLCICLLGFPLIFSANLIITFYTTKY